MNFLQETTDIIIDEQKNKITVGSYSGMCNLNLFTKSSDMLNKNSLAVKKV